MLRRYEMLFLTGPYLTSDESQRIEKTISKTITSNEGRVLSYDRWGKYKLAYEINRNAYGIYFLVRFESDNNVEQLLKEVDMLYKIKLNDLIMRSMVCKLDPKASLEYQRPESLEEAPVQARDYSKERGPRQENSNAAPSQHLENEDFVEETLEESSPIEG